MTVTVTPTFVQTPGNGATTVYNFPFLITAYTDLAVGFITGGIYTPWTGYTVSFTTGIQGGQITFSSAPPLGTLVDIRSIIPQSQPTNFANIGAYFPENTTNSVDRTTRLTGDQNRLTYLFGIHGPDYEGTPWPALPPPSQRLGMGLVFDTVTGLPGVGTLTPTPLTQSGFNGLLNGSNVGPLFYPMTQGEINASAPIVNAYVAPYNPLRYGLNAAPGLTPMDQAFQFAVNSLRGTPASPGPGGKMLVDLSAGPYNLTAGIDCTWAGSGNAPPIHISFVGSTHNAHPLSGCVLNHSTIGFDCTGNDTIIIEDASITTPVLPVPTIFPQIAILLARNTTKAGLVNRIIRPKISGYFSIANIYNYGGENFYLEAPFLTNYGTAGAGNCLLAVSANNYANVQSLVPGLIAIGSQSMTVNDIVAAAYTMNVPNSTSDCIHIEGVTEWRHWGGWAYNPGGRSVIYADNFLAGTTSYAPTNFVKIMNFRCEHVNGTTLQPQYMIYFGSSAALGTHSGWELRGLHGDTQQGVLVCADTNTTLNGLVCDPINEFQSKGISIPGQLSGFSSLRLGATILTIGTVTQGCEIIGYPANITVGGIAGGVGLGTLISNFAAQISGFGTPTGAATSFANFNGNTASATQTAQMVALILDIMKLKGDIAT